MTKQISTAPKCASNTMAMGVITNLTSFSHLTAVINLSLESRGNTIADFYLLLL